MKNPYYFIRRKTRKGLVWYCVFDYLPDRPKSTGILIEEDPGQVEATKWAESHYEKDWSRKKIPTFREYTDKFFTEDCHWRARMIGRGRTYNNGYFKQHRSRLENHMWPFLGSYTLDGISQKVIDKYLLDLKKQGYKHETIWKHLVGLRKIFGQAVYDEIIARSPAEAIEPFHGESERRGVFTREEQGKLFPRDNEVLLRIWGSHMWACYFLTASTCGTRPGETSAIRWEDWLRSQNGIIVRKSVKTGGKEIGGIKTEKKGVQRIPKPITDRLTQELLMYESSQQETSDLMFTLEGGPIGSPTACKHFKESVKRAGIEVQGRTPYSLRHSYETDLLEVMFDHEAQVLMGHRNEITKRYDQRSDEQYMKFAGQFREKIELVRGF